jgi:mono/diheme cytochrome c family protein
MRIRLKPRTAVLALLLAAAACGGGEEETPAASDVAAAASEIEEIDPALAAKLPEGVPFRLAEQGRELFPVCATCHGFEGEGTQLGPSLADPEWIHGTGTLQDIERVILSGVDEPETFPVPMPVLGGGEFTAEQVRALSAYVYLLSRRGG